MIYLFVMLIFRDITGFNWTDLGMADVGVPYALPAHLHGLTPRMWEAYQASLPLEMQELEEGLDHFSAFVRGEILPSIPEDEGSEDEGSDGDEPLDVPIPDNIEVLDVPIPEDEGSDENMLLNIPNSNFEIGELMNVIHPAEDVPAPITPMTGPSI